MEIFCFFLAILYVYTLNPLPLLSTALIFFITPKYPIPLFFILGSFVACVHQYWVAPKGMPDEAIIAHALVVGTIASLPLKNSNKVQFQMTLEQINHHPAQGLIQLAWYNTAPPIHSGEKWQFSVKLKRPRNFHNPGSSNYANSLATRHILWSGYIRSKNSILLAKSPPSFTWLKLREKLGADLYQLAPNQQTAGIVEALTLNLTTHISQEDWSLFRRTGTIHLFGISGEHIALISGIIFMLLKKLWSLNPSFCLRIPAISVASIGGLITAILYSLLAGFAPPVQRALVGCFFYTIYCLGKQRFSIWQIWRYALFIVLCLEPHAVFMQGFYFSFLAVVCLLLTQQRWNFKGYKGKLALQLSCLIGLMPLTFYWFSYGSINGFFANLFAIPLVGFLIVPLALIFLCVYSYSWAWIVMLPLSWLIALLFKGLTWIEHLAFLNINWSIESIIYVLSLMGALLLWVLLPVKPFKQIAIFWILLSFLPTRNLIKSGEVLIRVLDVGQGLAVAIQTQHHNLLYDTGDKFFQGSDLGAMVIVPFYTAIGVKQLDKIVISHPDKDHRGGLHSIEEQMPGAQLLVNDPPFYHRGINCHHYPQWEWDKVIFRFLPIKKTFPNKNNNSCILQISNASGRVLLTGDIEKIAEDYLVTTYGNELQSDILIVPHHGSKTSSSYRFLLEVNPKIAIASLGFDNRFHFPHAKTLESMNALAIEFFRTDVCGMTEIMLPKEGFPHAPLCYNKKSII